MTALARVTEGPTQSDLGSEFWYYLAVTIRGAWVQLLPGAPVLSRSQVNGLTPFSWKVAIWGPRRGPRRRSLALALHSTNAMGRIGRRVGWQAWQAS